MSPYAEVTNSPLHTVRSDALIRMPFYFSKILVPDSDFKNLSFSVKGFPVPVIGLLTLAGTFGTIIPDIQGRP